MSFINMPLSDADGGVGLGGSVRVVSNTAESNGTTAEQITWPS